jgi:hypothetical protein
MRQLLRLLLLKSHTGSRFISDASGSPAASSSAALTITLNQDGPARPPPSPGSLSDDGIVPISQKNGI